MRAPIDTTLLGLYRIVAPLQACEVPSDVVVLPSGLPLSGPFPPLARGATFGYTIGLSQALLQGRNLTRSFSDHTSFLRDVTADQPEPVNKDSQPDALSFLVSRIFTRGVCLSFFNVLVSLLKI
ncbi:hypothetical protein Tco_1065366 [Tanacetum coccineum]